MLAEVGCACFVSPGVMSPKAVLHLLAARPRPLPRRPPQGVPPPARLPPERLLAQGDQLPLHRLCICGGGGPPLIRAPGPGAQCGPDYILGLLVARHFSGLPVPGACLVRRYVYVSILVGVCFSTFVRVYFSSFVRVYFSVFVRVCLSSFLQRRRGCVLVFPHVPGLRIRRPHPVRGGYLLVSLSSLVIYLFCIFDKYYDATRCGSGPTSGLIFLVYSFLRRVSCAGTVRSLTSPVSFPSAELCLI